MVREKSSGNEARSELERRKESENGRSLTRRSILDGDIVERESIGNETRGEVVDDAAASLERPGAGQERGVSSS